MEWKKFGGEIQSVFLGKKTNPNFRSVWFKQIELSALLVVPFWTFFEKEPFEKNIV